jgi:hypothetical protein
MVLNNEKRSGTVRDGQGIWCHDDGLWVTLAKYGNGTVTGRDKIKIFTVSFNFLFNI